MYFQSTLEAIAWDLSSFISRSGDSSSDRIMQENYSGWTHNCEIFAELPSSSTSLLLVSSGEGVAIFRGLLLYCVSLGSLGHLKFYFLLFLSENTRRHELFFNTNTFYYIVHYKNTFNLSMYNRICILIQTESRLSKSVYGNRSYHFLELQ